VMGGLPAGGARASGRGLGGGRGGQGSRSKRGGGGHTSHM
jgi:hypothetical protein